LLTPRFVIFGSFIIRFIIWFRWLKNSNLLLQNHPGREETGRFFSMASKTPKTINLLFHNTRQRHGQGIVQRFWLPHAMGMTLFSVSDVRIPVGMILFGVSDVPTAWARYCSAFLSSPRRGQLNVRHF
jgi:hypothetical protein